MNKKQVQSVYINLAISVFAAVAALVYMFTMDSYMPEITEGSPSIVFIPTLALLAVAMYLLVDPQYMEI